MLKRDNESQDLSQTLYNQQSLQDNDDSAWVDTLLNDMSAETHATANIEHGVIQAHTLQGPIHNYPEANTAASVAQKEGSGKLISAVPAPPLTGSYENYAAAAAACFAGSMPMGKQEPANCIQEQLPQAERVLQAHTAASPAVMQQSISPLPQSQQLAPPRVPPASSPPPSGEEEEEADSGRRASKRRRSNSKKQSRGAQNAAERDRAQRLAQEISNISNLLVELGEFPPDAKKTKIAVLTTTVTFLRGEVARRREANQPIAAIATGQGVDGDLANKVQ